MSDAGDRVRAIIGGVFNRDLAEITDDKRLEPVEVRFDTIRKHFRTEAARPATAEDLGGDSLDRVEMMMEIEEEFSISISDDEGERLITVADVIDLVEDKLVKAMSN